MDGKSYMNPAHGKHMEGGHEAPPHHAPAGHHPPHIHIHRAAGKTHVHILHHDSAPEMHEHDPNDTEGIKAHIDEHYGAGGDADAMEPEEDGGGADL